MDNKKKTDRPLECSGCSKPINVHYCEVEDEIVKSLHTCNDCPLIQKYCQIEASPGKQPLSGLSCAHCSTSLEELLQGELLGCANCYQVFNKEIVDELIDRQYLSPQIEPMSLVHPGHKPGEMKKLSPSLKIFALNEELSKTIDREDYEQAAWIRDQIKQLKTKDTNDD